MRDREKQTFIFFQINIQNNKAHSTYKHTKPKYNEQGYLSSNTVNVT